MAALHFLLPTGHSPSGSSGFDSKLISLLPLDEVPVHVPLRRPRPLRFERLRVGGEGKADANLTNFLSTCCALPECHPPRSRRPPPHHEGAREPRSPSLAAVCEASSTQSRNVEGQAGAGGATPRRPACRWSSDKRSRTTGSAGSSYYEGRSPRSARLGDRRRRIPSVFGQPTGSRAGARIAGTGNPPASGTEPDTSGRPLRWRIQAETGEESQERTDAALPDTTAGRNLKQPDKQKTARWSGRRRKRRSGSFRRNS